MEQGNMIALCQNKHKLEKMMKIIQLSRKDMYRALPL